MRCLGESSGNEAKYNKIKQTIVDSLKLETQHWHRKCKRKKESTIKPPVVYALARNKLSQAAVTVLTGRVR